MGRVSACISTGNVYFECFLGFDEKRRNFMIDLFIAVAAVIVVILVTAQQVKTYKKDGSAAFCGGNCSRCNENCVVKK